MEEKRYIKMSLGTAVCLIIIIILLVALIALGIYTYTTKNTNVEKNYANNDINYVNEYNTEEYSKKETEISNTTETTNKEEIFEDKLVDYIVKSIKIYAENGNILKSTIGDINADKLSVQEFENNKSIYEEKIKEMITDKSIFSEKFIKNNKQCYTYKFEKILNQLGIGTHMGIGIGCYDSHDNKIYEDGKTEIEEDRPTNSNIIKYFGYEDKVYNTILDEIEKCARDGYILKDINGDVTAQKLTLSEAQRNREIYKDKINEIIDDGGIFTEIYFENNKLNVKCYFEKILNKLEIGTHMGIGINIDEEGIQTFVID